MSKLPRCAASFPLGAAAAVLTACVGIGSTVPTDGDGLTLSQDLIPYSLPKSFLSIKVGLVGTETAKSLVMNVKALNVADPHSQLALRYRHSALSHDEFCVATNGNGLLSAVHFKGRDRTGDVLVRVADLVTRFARFRSLEGDPDLPPKETIFARVIDFDRKLRHRRGKDRYVYLANETKIVSGQKRFSISVDHHGYFSRAGAKPYSDHCPDGYICYRRTVPVTFQLHDGEGKVVQTSTVSVVDPSRVYKVAVTRAFLVEKVTKLTFSAGVLSGVYMRKPSEAAALASLPLAILDRILEVPSNFIARAFGTAESRKSVKDDRGDKRETIDTGNTEADVTAKVTCG